MVMVLDLLGIRVGVGNVNCSSGDNKIYSLVLISRAHGKWMQKYLHSRLKTIVNADISAFTFENICECRYFCIHARTKICECRYFCIHARPKIYECRYFPIHVWPKFVNADICAFTLGQKILECRYFCIPKSGMQKLVHLQSVSQKLLECECR